MRIVYDVSQIRYQRAGIGRLATMQLQGLLAADQQREYILHGWSPDLDLELLGSLRRPNVRLAVAQLPGVVKRLYWNYLRFPSLSAVVGPFDVFHGAEPLLPPIKKEKAIVSFNDSAYYKFRHFYSAVTARKWDYLYRRAIQRADIVTVLSESTRSDLIEMMALPPEKIHLVRPPTDPLFFHMPAQQDFERVEKTYALPDEFVLFVGTLEPRKNIPRLITAFEQFSIDKSISLIIVGRRGWLYEDILHTIATSPARAKVRLLDYVPDIDLAVLYRRATMFVFPSLYEGHGYPVIEAMASGVPVVTSRNSSLQEIGKDAALLVDAEDVTELCDAMKLLYRNASLRQELIEKGRQRAHMFSVEQAVNAILEVYAILEH